MANWLQDSLATQNIWDNNGLTPATDVNGTPWWTVPTLGNVGGATPSAYGQRLGSYRLLNMARQRAQQEQALQQLGGAQNGAGGLASAYAGVPAVTPSMPQAPQAPDWLTGAAGPGSWLRELVRPDKTVFQRGGTLLEGAGRALGSLAQGAESTLGVALGELPSVGGTYGTFASEVARNTTLPDAWGVMFGGLNDAIERTKNNPESIAAVKAARPEGWLALRPSAAAAAAQQARDVQAAFGGQDFSKKYREQTPWLMKSIAEPDSAERFAFGMATNIAYTGTATNDARQRAQQRILLGEDPTVVLRGMVKPGADAYGDEVAQYNEKAQEFIQAQGRGAFMAALKQGASRDQAQQIATQAQDDAGRWVSAQGRIPGEETPWAEMAGQMALDPLNLPGAHMVIEAITKPVVTKALGVEKAVKQASTIYDNSMRAALETYKTGLYGFEQRALSKAAASSSELAKSLAKAWKAVRAYAPVTTAKQMAGAAFRQLGTLINDATTGKDALDIITRFVKDPDSLMATFGAVPRNLYSEAARPVVAKVLEKLSALPALQAEKFNAVQFLAEAFPEFETAARELAGAPAKGAKMTGVIATAQQLKSWMSEFYLRTPGYIVRNFLSDNAIATMDGLQMFDDMNIVRARLERFGVSTERVNAAGEVLNATAEAMGNASRLGQIPIIKEIKPLVALQNKIGEIASKAEEARYLRAYDSALTQFRAANWAPQLSAATRQLFEQAGLGHVADAIEAGWRQAQSARDIRRVVGDVLNASHPAEQFFVTRFGIDPMDISPELAVHLEQQARAIAQRGGTADEFAAVVNRLIEDAKAKAATGLRDLGVITKPRATTAADVLQDVADELRSAEQRLAQAVNHGEVTKEEAQRILQDFRANLLAQNQQRAAAVQSLHDALGQVSPEATEHTLAAALHPVDLEHELRDQTRQAVDRLWIAEKRKPSNARDWANYFEQRKALWNKAASQTVDEYNKAVQAINELNAAGATPEALDAVLKKYGMVGVTDKADELLARTRARMFDVNLNAEGERAASEAMLQQFWDERLKPQRVRWDEARANARRYLVQMIRANPGLAQDGMDIWIAAQRAVDIRFSQAAARQEGLISQMLAKEIDYDTYRKLSGEEWGKAFDFAVQHNGESTIARIKSLETRRGLVAQALGELGYKGDELRRLVGGFSDGTTREEVAGIIRDGKRAPVTPDVTTDTGAPGATGATSSGSGATSATQAMNPPATVDEWVAAHGGDAEAALAHARQMQDQTAGLVDFGLSEARAASTASVPTVREINQYLDASGQLKNAEADQKALTELAELHGFVPNPDVPGGEMESIRAWLEQARGLRSGARGAPGKAAQAAAEDAYGKWEEIIQELGQRVQHAAGMSAQESALRTFVRQTISDQGVAQGADTVRQLAAGGDADAQVMLDELRAYVHEQARSILENSDDLAQGYAQVEKLLADAVFGTRNEVTLGDVTAHMGDAAGVSQALAEFRAKLDIVQVPGLEKEARIDTIRQLADELGIDGKVLTEGETAASDIYFAARDVDAQKALAVLHAPTVKGDGRITAEAWAKLGIEGERRTPGEVLREMAGKAVKPSGVTREALAARVATVTTVDELKAAVGSDAHVMRWGDKYGTYVSITNRKAGIVIEGHGANEAEAVQDALRQLGVKPGTTTATTATKAGPRMVEIVEPEVPQAVLDAEARAERAAAKAKAARAAYKADPTPAKAQAVDDAAANARAAGIQASEARKAAGVKPPMERVKPGTRRMVPEDEVKGATGTKPGATKAGADDVPSDEVLSAADEAVETAGGNAEPLGNEDLLATAEKRQIAALGKIRDGMVGDWERLVDPHGIPKGARAAMEAELKSMMPRWYTFRNAATYAAQARADFAMLDYSLKRGGDVYAAAVAPYYYWGSRQARNFAVRLLQRPQNILALQRYQETMRKEAQRQGLRGRFEGMWQVAHANGYDLYLDPTAILFPWADLVQTDVTDATDSRSALANVYQAASQLGFRPGPWIDIPLRASNALVGGTPGTPEYAQEEAAVGKGSIGSLIPQTGLIKGATALAGIGTPGGVDIEQPLRRALGLGEATPFEPYIVARAVRDLAAERGVQPGAHTPYLLAQALITNAGDPTSGYGWSGLLNGQVTPQAIATQFHTTAEEAQAALGIVRQAADRAGKQKGVGQMASALLGQRVQVLTPGEKVFGQLQQAERAGAYNAATGTGSMADMQAVRDANPALAVGRAQYGTLPGETTDPTKIYQSAQRDTVNAAFDALKDAVIAQQPWNRDAGSAVEDARKRALDSLGGGQAGQPASGWQTEYQKAIAAVNGTGDTTPQTYKPRALYGANPQEAAQIRIDEAMRYVAGTRPKLAQFTGSHGYPDHAAYSAATAEWEQRLPEIARGNDLVRQVVEQSDADGYGNQVRAALGKIDMGAVRQYWQRNDSPLEAAQRAWFATVYEPAMATVKQKTRTRTLPDNGVTSTAALIGMVQQMYPGRWSDGDLQTALNGMTMPSVRDVATRQLSPAGRQAAAADAEFMAQVEQQFGQRGVDALTAYDAASGATAKAQVRRRYAVLARLLPLRAEAMAQLK